MKSKRILIVEDDTKQSKLIKDALEKCDFVVDIAVDGESALAGIKEKHYDLVLLDLILPGIGGIGLLKAIRSRDNLINLPVIIVTNSENRDHMADVADYNVSAYFVKAETKLEDIMKSINELLN